MVYYGGVIRAEEVQTLKRLLFRASRGKVLLTTFDMEVDPEDQVRGENFHLTMVGYIIMFEQSKPMQNIVERVCQSFSLGSGQFASISF